MRKYAEQSLCSSEEGSGELQRVCMMCFSDAGPS